MYACIRDLINDFLFEMKIYVYISISSTHNSSFIKLYLDLDIKLLFITKQSQMSKLQVSDCTICSKLEIQILQVKNSFIS